MIRQQRPIRNAEVGGLKPFAYKLVRQVNEELEEKGFTTGSKRGLETRVSLKKALAELGFKGGTRCEAERN